MTTISAIVPERRLPLLRVEYERMVEQGRFDDERVELLRGVVVEMSPQGPLHAEVVERLQRLLWRLLDDRVRVRSQSPVALSDDSAPEPDIFVFPAGEYSDQHPSDARLIIEVADSSLPKDRGAKAEIYAENGVPEYWIINLVERVIEVHRKPEGKRFSAVTTKRRGESIVLAEFPDIEIAVSKIL